LNFRAAGRHAEKLLRDSSDELVESVAATGYFEEVTAPDLLMKLFEAEREQQTSASADMKLARLLRSRTSAGRSQQIATLLADPTFNFASDASKNSLSDVAREFPNMLNAALVSQIEAGKELPRHAKDYLSETLTRDVGPVREYMATPGTSAAKGAALIAGRELTHDLCLRYLASYAAAASGGDRSQGAWQPTRDLEAVLALTPTSSFFAAIARFGSSTPPEDISGLCRLMARCCRDVDRGRATLSTELHPDVFRTLQNWAEALLLSSNDRSQLADLAGAMQRVPDPTHVDVLDRMLRRDQDLHAQARQAYKANPQDNSALQDIRIWHNWTYRDALVAVGTDPATSVLTVHLSDEYFGLDAAVGLMLIWRKRHGREGQIRPGIWPDADAIVANRESRKIDPGATTPEAEAIFARVETLLSGGEPDDVRRAASMASAATLLPHGDKTGILGQLLAAGLPASNTYGLLSHMAVGGIILKAVDVMAGLESALAEIKDLAWVSEQNAEALLWWLGLFPGSDDPMALFTAIDRMPKTVSIHGWRMRHVLRLVEATAERAAPHILRELVARFPELTDEYELQLALLRQPLDVLLDIMLEIADGKIGSRRGLEGVAYRFPGQVYERLTSSDIGRVIRRFQEAVQGPGKVFLGQILLAANDPEVFLMLAEDASGRAAAGDHLWMTLRDLLHDKVRINGSPVHHELIARDSSRLREGLFLMTLSGDQGLSSFGTRCLTIVDEIRDEEGTSGIERRHPSIATGRPWPDVVLAT
jgi:NACHT conflict system protein